MSGGGGWPPVRRLCRQRRLRTDSRPSPRTFQHAAAALGFVNRRQTRSHQRWTHSDGRSVTIPHVLAQTHGDARLAGYEDLIDAVRLSTDSTFRLMTGTAVIL
jgi:hypothetical protein